MRRAMPGDVDSTAALAGLGPALHPLTSRSWARQGLLLKSGVHVAYLIPRPAAAACRPAPRLVARPASPTALAWYLAEAARAHDAPLLVSARDNHGANQLEADLQTLLGGDPALPVVAFLTGKPCPTTASARIRTSSRSAWLPCTACPR